MLAGASVYGEYGALAGWGCEGELGGGKAGPAYGGYLLSIPGGIDVLFNTGLNPLVIGMNADSGWVGTAAYVAGPEEENGRRPALPGTDGDGSVGRVKGNTDADQR